MSLKAFFIALLGWDTVAQKAAKIAMLDIADKFGRACEDHSNSLDELEKRLINQNMPLIESLIRDHDLCKGYASDYKEKMVRDLFNGAGSRGEFVWQAALAKKYKL
jgi:hypothetical protein